MIEKEMIFITGAGASCEFGFPTGPQLIQNILNYTYEEFIDNKNYFDESFNITKEEYSKFIERLKYSNAPSIDIFIANNLEFSDLAKTIIVKIISRIEFESFDRLFQNSWLKYIWNKMIEGCMDFDSFAKNKVKFITFNYDRTLELFFSLSISNFFGKVMNNSNINKEIFKIIPIYHVFGKVGKMDFEDKTTFRRLGITPDGYNTWFNLSKEIFTIYEAKKRSEHSEMIREITKSKEIYFLGFGYNSFNLKFLNFQGWHSEINGTRYELSKTEILDISYLFNNEKFSKIQRVAIDADCYAFLKHNVNFFDVPQLTLKRLN